MESVLMTMPPSRSASASASADLPLAVGPAISTATLRASLMTYAATLIAQPAQPISEALARRAAAALGAAGITWLDPGLALDIPFTPDGADDNRIVARRSRAALSPLLDG